MKNIKKELTELLSNAYGATYSKIDLSDFDDIRDVIDYFYEEMTDNVFRQYLKFDMNDYSNNKHEKKLLTAIDNWFEVKAKEIVADWVLCDTDITSCF